MRLTTALIIAVTLCIIAIPAMAGEEPKDLNDGDNIWIAISPTESHPALVDRPYAVIPLVAEYRIKVAVYSNPYDDIDYIDDEIDSGGSFEVTSLVSSTARLTDQNGNTAEVYDVHEESEDKYTYIFLVKDFDLRPGAGKQRLIFTAEDGVGNTYQGSGLVNFVNAQKGKS